MSGRHWMPLYVGDYLADTARLTTEQHGAYLLLLFDLWRSGPIPDDDEVLANVAKLPGDRWARHRPILQRFFRIEKGHWHHGRIERELERVQSKAEANAERARKAAAARWGSDKQPEDATSNARSNARSMPEAKLGACQPQPEPEPQLQAQSEPSKTKPLADARFSDFWAVYPRKEGKKTARRRWVSQKLDQHADEIIDDVQARLKDSGQWKAREARFIPTPTVYLNQERWCDEWSRESGAGAGRLPRETMSPAEIEEANRREAERAAKRWASKGGAS